MIFAEPIPFEEAIQGRRAKQFLPTELSTAELDALGAEVREMASFSAGVTDAYILQRFDDLTVKLAGGATEEDFARRAAGEGPLLVDPASARLEMKEFLRQIKYEPKPGEEGTIKDLSTDARINLKLRTDVEMAQGYGNHVAGQNPTTLDLIPCQELVRVSRRKVPRNWPSRWRAAGGEFFAGGRMIAAKDSPVWKRLSRFGLPYPPFDFNSGMGVRNIRRPEAEALGVIEPGQQIEPQPRKLTDDLQASATQFSGALQQALQDTGYRLEGGVLKNRAAQSVECLAEDGAPDPEVAAAIYASYHAEDDSTWDVSDDERAALNDDDLADLAASRYLRAQMIVAGIPILNAAKAAKVQFRCPKGTARGGRFARNAGECGGPSKSKKPAAGKPEPQPAPRKAREPRHARTAVEARQLLSRYDSETLRNDLNKAMDAHDAARGRKTDAQLAGNKAEAARIQREEVAPTRIAEKKASRAFNEQHVADARARELVQIPPNQRASMALANTDQEVGEAARTGLQEAAKYVHTDAWAGRTVKAASAGTTGRASAGFDGTIHIRPDEPPGVVAHEAMHLHEHDSEVLRQSLAFLDRRTPGETPRPLKEVVPGANYRDGEVTREDQWAERGGSPYTGKDYSQPQGRYASEILSTGIERMMANPAEFARRDPEFFDFTFAALRRPRTRRANTGDGEHPPYL